MLRTRLNEEARITRLVTIGSEQVATVTAAVGPWRPARFAPPTATAPADDASPRGQAATTLEYVEGWLALGPLDPGDRVERRRGAIALEVVRAARAVFTRSGAVDGWAVDVLPVAELYPVTASLQEQGGAIVRAALTCAIWSDSTRREPTGEYHDRLGEAPVEFAAELAVANRQLVLGSQKLRITSAEVDVTGPRVRLSLRRVNA